MQNFYRDLQQPVRLSDAQLEELRSRILKGVLPQIQAQDEAISEATQNTTDLTGFVVGDTTGTLPPPVDDGQTLSPPQHLVLAPVPYHELDATWDATPPLQYIAKSIAEVTPSGGSPFTVEGPADEIAITNLAAVSTSVRVKLVNAWGRESAYCAPQSATPLLTAAEQINFNTLTLGTTLQGLLPNGALAQIIDPGKLGDNAVKAVANAANKNILPYIESQPDHYDAGAWATVGPGKQTYNNASTSIVVDSSAVKRWQVTATATDGWSEAFAASDYGQKTGNWYIYSVQCSNPSGTAHSGRVSVVYYDSLGNALGETVGSYTSIPGNGSAQIYVNFQIPAGTSSIRFKRWVQTAGTSLNFTNAMLEEVSSTTTTPSPYTIPAMFTGILGANTVAALDVLGVNAIFKNASISNAVIANLSVDKLLTGSITSASITIAGSGALYAGTGVTLDAGGLTLQPSSAQGAFGQEVANKISSVGDWGEVYFFDDGTNRGPYVSSQGSSSFGRTAVVVLSARSSGGNLSFIDVFAPNSAPGSIVVNPSTFGSQGSVQFTNVGSFTVNGVSVLFNQTDAVAWTNIGPSLKPSRGLAYTAESLRWIGNTTTTSGTPSDAASPVNHTHSTTNFQYDYTQEERWRAINFRAAVEGIPDDRLPTREEWRDVKGLLLDLARQSMDHPDERAEQWMRRIEEDKEYGHFWRMKYDGDYHNAFLQAHHPKFKKRKDPEFLQSVKSTSHDVPTDPDLVQRTFKRFNWWAHTPEEDHGQHAGH